jgi:hypothetical protein
VPKLLELYDIWVNIFMNHVKTRTIIPSYEGSCVVYIDIMILKTKITSKTHTLIETKNDEILIIDTRTV